MHLVALAKDSAGILENSLENFGFNTSGLKLVPESVVWLQVSAPTKQEHTSVSW